MVGVQDPASCLPSPSTLDPALVDENSGADPNRIVTIREGGELGSDLGVANTVTPDQGESRGQPEGDRCVVANARGDREDAETGHNDQNLRAIPDWGRSSRGQVRFRRPRPESGPTGA